jgi:hypothetical protein
LRRKNSTPSKIKIPPTTTEARTRLGIDNPEQGPADDTTSSTPEAAA